MRIYEINTWVWLSELSEKQGNPVKFESIPDREWDVLVPMGFDAVWLMGVWQRSAMGRELARHDDVLLRTCRALLPDLKSDDIVGSPYCVHEYVADERLGGPAGLAVARAQLAKRNLKLILDFVPNHTAPDHPWTILHPEYYVQGSLADRERDSRRYFLTDLDYVFARGAPALGADDIWADTIQLNAFNPGYRDAAILTLVDIASQCDGVRCDMAMLLQNATFEANWPVGPAPELEFWAQVIRHVKARYPEMILIAETYGNSEWDLQQQGFDYCYDKDVLYERLAHGDAESVRQHLRGSAPEYLSRLIHFIENHDELPATEVFRPVGRHQAVALVTATLPGASLWYDRQFDGRWGHQPVQLGRSCSLRDFYRKLLTVTAHPTIRHGQWSWCPVEPTANLLAWAWTRESSRLLVVVNLSSSEAWGRVSVPWDCLSGNRCSVRDLFTGDDYGVRDGSDIVERGLLVGRAGWGFHLLEIVVE